MIKEYWPLQIPTVSLSHSLPLPSAPHFESQQNQAVLTSNTCPGVPYTEGMQTCWKPWCAVPLVKSVLFICQLIFFLKQANGFYYHPECLIRYTLGSETLIYQFFMLLYVGHNKVVLACISFFYFEFLRPFLNCQRDSIQNLLFLGAIKSLNTSNPISQFKFL